jgi:hypothetical protein
MITYRANRLRASLAWVIATACLTAVAAGRLCASDLTNDLNASLKGKTVDGYTTRNWRYRRGGRMFVIAVADGRKWREEYTHSGGRPRHGVQAALTAALILEQHAVTPAPQVFIFKDGNKVLYRLRMDTALNMLSSDLRAWVAREQRRQRLTQPTPR